MGSFLTPVLAVLTSVTAARVTWTPTTTMSPGRTLHSKPSEEKLFLGKLQKGSGRSKALLEAEQRRGRIPSRCAQLPCNNYDRNSPLQKPCRGYTGGVYNRILDELYITRRRIAELADKVDQIGDFKECMERIFEKLNNCEGVQKTRFERYVEKTQKSYDTLVKIITERVGVGGGSRGDWGGSSWDARGFKDERNGHRHERKGGVSPCEGDVLSIKSNVLEMKKTLNLIQRSSDRKDPSLESLNTLLTFVRRNSGKLNSILLRVEKNEPVKRNESCTSYEAKQIKDTHREVMDVLRSVSRKASQCTNEVRKFPRGGEGGSIDAQMVQSIFDLVNTINSTVHRLSAGLENQLRRVVHKTNSFTKQVEVFEETISKNAEMIKNSARALTKKEKACP